MNESLGEWMSLYVSSDNTTIRFLMTQLIAGFTTFSRIFRIYRAGRSEMMAKNGNTNEKLPVRPQLRDLFVPRILSLILIISGANKWAIVNIRYFSHTHSTFNAFEILCRIQYVKCIYVPWTNGPSSNDSLRGCQDIKDEAYPPL